MISRWAALAVFAAAPSFAASADSYLPWEGGPACYKQWPQGPSASPDTFPVLVWLQAPARAADYRAIGINQFMGLWKGPTADQLAALSDAAMPVMASYREGFVKHPLLRGWTLMDEPDNAQAKPGGGWGSCVLPPDIVAQYRKLKAADPTRPVYLNLGQGVIYDAYKGRGSDCARHMEHYPEYIHGADIVSYDVYPVNGDYPLWWVGAGIDRLRQWADYKKPVWNWIETTAIRGEHKPTPEQIRSEVWMSLIHGSMGIGYFCHQFKPKFDEAAPLHDEPVRLMLASINRQIAALARVLNTPSIANGVTVKSSAPIDTMLKRHAGATYLFAMGARPGPRAAARFQLRDTGDAAVEVMGESRRIPVRAGAFEDQFSEYQVHLYKLQ